MVRIYLDFSLFFPSADESKSNNKRGDEGILQNYSFAINC
jgi:hypothetical protein